LIPDILDLATDHLFQESFYSKLKTFADELNTNLYVSNLPKSMNEHELGNFFAPHKVCSARILRDRNGHGRGVGFARYVLATP
jgi:RNA recognition motif-containing protein